MEVCRLRFPVVLYLCVCLFLRCSNVFPCRPADMTLLQTLNLGVQRSRFIVHRGSRAEIELGRVEMMPKLRSGWGLIALLVLRQSYKDHAIQPKSSINVFTNIITHLPSCLNLKL